MSYGTTEVTVTPTSSDATATIEAGLHGGALTPVASGSASDPIALAVGPNVIDVVVTASDAITVRTYTITVTRALSSDATLVDLTTTAGALAPAFTPKKTSYTAGPVSSSTSSVTVTPTATDDVATIKVRVNKGAYVDVVSGDESSDLPLKAGSNTIEIRVTAQNGKAKTYTVSVKRDAAGGGGGGNGGAAGTVTGDLACSGAYTGTTVTGSVIVPPGATCSFSGGTIRGAVIVQAGARFTASNSLAVFGAILAQGAASVSIDQVKANGPIRLMNVTGASSVCRSSASDIIAMFNSGAVTIGAPACAGGNTLAGSLQAQLNAGALKISNNKMNGPLLCLGNSPAPTGSGNAASVKLGQCAAL